MSSVEMRIRPELDRRLGTLDFKTADASTAQRVHDKFIGYCARAATAGTDITDILSHALTFTQLEMDIEAASASKSTAEGTALFPEYKCHLDGLRLVTPDMTALRVLIQRAVRSGAATAEEILDFLVEQDRRGTGLYNPLISNTCCASLLLENLMVEATGPRLGALARCAEAVQFGILDKETEWAEPSGWCSALPSLPALSVSPEVATSLRS